MARPLRVEYAGARYHLMGRGNQFRDIFQSQGDADLFIRCLGELCDRNGTIVHAWCLMSNHYHLLLETPRGDLVDAMKWFLGTFTQRYNARHHLAGHLFQGRYKGKIVENADPSYFRRVSEYIHLNPAAAQLTRPGNLAAYPWSSYPFYLAAPAQRPPWLAVGDVLRATGLSGDSPSARKAYASYMEMKHAMVARKLMETREQTDWDKMEQGWIHGSREFRKRLVENLAAERQTNPRRLVDLEQKRDISQEAAEAVFKRCLKHFRLDEAALREIPKSDPIKLLMAGLLRRHYPVGVAWIAEKLAMGHYTTVCRAMRFYDKPPEAWTREKQRILKFIG